MILHSESVPSSSNGDDQSMNDFNRNMIEHFRASRAKGETPGGGRPLILLTTTGAKSGKAHTTPVRPLFYGDQMYVIAFNRGASSDPDWYRNLIAHPEVTVESGKDTFKADAQVATGIERDRLWAGAVATDPAFEEAQARVARQMPVIILERRKG
jgi:deazaflavin-dependent oxidoreductase (nitroreductase family)